MIDRVIGDKHEKGAIDSINQSMMASMHLGLSSGRTLELKRPRQPAKTGEGVSIMASSNSLSAEAETLQGVPGSSRQSKYNLPAPSAPPLPASNSTFTSIFPAIKDALAIMNKELEVSAS